MGAVLPLGQRGHQCVNRRVVGVDAIQFERIPTEVIFLAEPIGQRADHRGLPDRIAKDRLVFGAHFTGAQEAHHSPQPGRMADVPGGQTAEVALAIFKPEHVQPILWTTVMPPPAFVPGPTAKRHSFSQAIPGTCYPVQFRFVVDGNDAYAPLPGFAAGKPRRSRICVDIGNGFKWTMNDPRNLARKLRPFSAKITRRNEAVLRVAGKLLAGTEMRVGRAAPGPGQWQKQTVGTVRGREVCLSGHSFGACPCLWRGRLPGLRRVVVRPAGRSWDSLRVEWRRPVSACHACSVRYSAAALSGMARRPGRVRFVGIGSQVVKFAMPAIFEELDQLEIAFPNVHSTASPGRCSRGSARTCAFGKASVHFEQRGDVG